jgi:DNA modification methylase
MSESTNAPRDALTIVYLPPAELTPYVHNARTHPKQQLAQIEASIRAHGFVNPILIDEDGVVIAGHGRLIAAKALGLTEVPTIRLQGLSEAQRRQLRIADNKIALNSEWDLDLLKLELEALSAPGLSFDLDSLGFSVGELDTLLAPAKASAEDVVPPTPKHAITELGDLWILGLHRIGCGDCRDESFLRQVVGRGMVDAAFADPPYNIRLGGNAVAKGRHREFAMAVGEMSRADFTGFLAEALGAAARVSKPGAVHFVCMDHHHLAELLDAGDAVYGRRLNICVWNKSNGGMGALYRSKHELVGVFVVGDTPHFNAVELGRHGRNRTNVWDYPSVNTLKGSRRHDLALHPTVKPISLVADAIQDVTRRDERVLDSFLGSGTTLLAAERVGRRCVGIELDPLYVDLALGRWSSLTGREPVLEATGQTWAQVREARRSETPLCA